MDIFVGPIGHSHGISRPIESLQDTATSADIIESMRRDGFVSYVRHDADVIDMAAEAICDCLGECSMDPKSIDAIILSTESSLSSSQTVAELRERLLDKLHRIGLVNAQLYGNFLSECANVTTTLSLARSLIVAGQHSSVLVVLAEQHPHDSPRITSSGPLSVLWSDMAVCCLLSAEESGCRLRSIVTLPAWQMHLARRDCDLIGSIVEWRNALHGLASLVELATGLAPRRYRGLVFENHQSSFLRTAAYGLGVSPAQLLQPLKGRIAHAFSLELLLSLKELRRLWSDRESEIVGFVNIGTSSFGFWTVETA